MQYILSKTIVLRHRKENLKKCSLTGLEARPDMEFYLYPKQRPPQLANTTLLSIDALPLSPKDAERPLFLLDGTWRYAEKMHQTLEKEGLLEGAVARSIPSPYHTAYPRKQDDCANPDRGLASVEALYIAYLILGWSTEGLLDHYYWKEKFLSLNNL